VGGGRGHGGESIRGERWGAPPGGGDDDVGRQEPLQGADHGALGGPPVAAQPPAPGPGFRAHHPPPPTTTTPTPTHPPTTLEEKDPRRLPGSPARTRTSCSARRSAPRAPCATNPSPVGGIHSLCGDENSRSRMVGDRKGCPVKSNKKGQLPKKHGIQTQTNIFLGQTIQIGLPAAPKAPPLGGSF